MNVIIYCVHKKLLDHADPDGTITRQEILRLFGERYHIPKELKDKAIRYLMDNEVILSGSKGGNLRKGYYIINRKVKAVSA